MSVLPFLALLCAQLFTSSWHVLGKHVMSTVPYLSPIAYILVRTLISATLLLTLGRIYEGPVKFPRLFKQKLKAKSPQSGISMISIESGNSIGMSLSPSASTIESMSSSDSITDKKMEDLPSAQNTKQSSYFHRSRRRKRNSSQEGNHCFTFIIRYIFYIVLISQKEFTKLLKNMNTEALQIVAAGTSGMLLLPGCYTTGLIMTSPTIASVWDGPMIPLGCFCAAVLLKLEKRSERYPLAQIGSLLLAVGGSLIVLMADFIHGNDHKTAEDKDAGMDHMQFIQGNMVLSGIVAAYSATALLQKQLNHYPPITLTGWMFGIGCIGCFGALLLDSILLGGTLTGCTLGQALSQLYLALTTSPTFRYGLLYSAYFVGGACFAIASYASSHLESSVITLFAACQPPMTAGLEWIWEGKGFGWKKVVGMCFVCCGMCGFTYIKRVESHHKHKKPVP